MRRRAGARAPGAWPSSTCPSHGHQPMASSRRPLRRSPSTARSTTSRELRGELDGPGIASEGSSDTEVLVAAVQRWGLRRRPRARATGCSAWPCGTAHERRLQLARDRFGEKPLYYGWSGGVFLFGSELKALRAHPAFRAEVDRDVLALYLRHNCVPAPYSIYRGIAKVLPASIVTIERHDAPGHAAPGPRPSGPWPTSPRRGAAVEDQRLIGGSPGRARRRAAGRGAGSGCTPTCPSAPFCREASTRRWWWPSCRPSTAPKVQDLHHRLRGRRLRRGHARQGGGRPTWAPTTTSCASRRPRRWRSIPTPARHLRRALRRLLADPHCPPGPPHPAPRHRGPVGRRGRRAVRGIQPLRVGRAVLGPHRAGPPPSAGGGGGRRSAPSPRRGGTAPSPRRDGRPAPRRRRCACRPRRCQGGVGAGCRGTSPTPTGPWRRTPTDPTRLVPGATEPGTVLTDPAAWPRLDDPVELMMYLDAVTYLPDDILTKVDRATMAASLEARVPFLDPDVAALAWRLPRDHEGAGGHGQMALAPPPAPLRAGRAWWSGPRPVSACPSATGCAVPCGDGPRTCSTPATCVTDGSSTPRACGNCGRSTARAGGDRQFELWDVLMLQAWLAAGG